MVTETQTHFTFTVRSRKACLADAQVVKKAVVPFIRVGVITTVRVDTYTTVQTWTIVTRMRNCQQRFIFFIYSQTCPKLPWEQMKVAFIGRLGCNLKPVFREWDMFCHKNAHRSIYVIVGAQIVSFCAHKIT